MNTRKSGAEFLQLLANIKLCRVCEAHLPHGPRPVLQADPKARVMIAGQAPGRRVHESGVPFDDPSGVRLREWMGVSDSEFYDASKIAILPMGFCFPGSGKSGDLPPRPECAKTWRDDVLQNLPNVQLTLVIGQYAQQWHLPHLQKNLTETVRQWSDYGPGVIPLPHPSPRNNIWLNKNPWFIDELLPELKRAVRRALS